MALETATQPKSFRVQFKYWLNITNDTEAALADFCEYLKSKRLFTQTIREGLMIINDLRAGRLDSLLSLFPQVDDLIEQEVQKRLATRKNGGSGDGTGNLDQKLERIEKLLLSTTTGNNSGGMLEMAKSQQMKALPSPSIEPAIAISKAKSEVPASWTFAISTAGITGNFDKLPIEVLQYAIDSGKVKQASLSPATRAKLDHQKQHTTPIAPIVASTGNAKAMQINTDLPLPSFDDDDISLFA